MANPWHTRLYSSGAAANRVWGLQILLKCHRRSVAKSSLLARDMTSIIAGSLPAISFMLALSWSAAAWSTYMQTTGLLEILIDQNERTAPDLAHQGVLLQLHCQDMPQLLIQSSLWPVSQPEQTDGFQSNMVQCCCPSGVSHNAALGPITHTTKQGTPVPRSVIPPPTSE
jgi:hypothetical protein